MPPVSPQGSRAGLVAGLVIFAILFVTSTVFAIYYGVQNAKAEETLVSERARMKDIAQDTTGPDVTDLKTLAMKDHELPESTALQEAMRQREDLRKIINGPSPATQPTDVTATVNRAQAAINAANATLGNAGAAPAAAAGDTKAAGGDNLVQVVAALTSEVGRLSTEVQSARADRDAAREQATKDVQTAKEAQAKSDSDVKDAVAKIQQQADAYAAAAKAKDDELTGAKKTFDDEQKNFSAQADASEKQRIDLTKQMDELNRSLTELRTKLAKNRVKVEDPIVRRTQGQIFKLADAHTVYINLGSGSQVVPGMTFEVYDKHEPLPKLGLGTSEENMPVGKGSIEVVRVLDGSSECHVTHVEPGQLFVEGDLILNIVYDPNTKYNFYVYGDFDPSRTGHPNPGGADVIKRLVNQFGGKVSNALNVDTDFVVMGTPPEVPTYTAEELKDALAQQELANKKAAADKYEAIVKQAIDLHIPIMNQNRFLYFTGYYDLAQR